MPVGLDFKLRPSGRFRLRVSPVDLFPGTQIADRMILEFAGHSLERGVAQFWGNLVRYRPILE